MCYINCEDPPDETAALINKNCFVGFKHLIVLVLADNEGICEQ